MPRLLNCIKNCCYTTLLVAFITAISSIFVWQAEVYQSTIDEQVRTMKLDLSAMKKENHLMEIKLNEQFGKHDDLKEEFRYLIKQAKWSANMDGDKANEDKERDPREVEFQFPNNKALVVGGDEDDDDDDDDKALANVDDVVNKALLDAVKDVGDEQHEVDLSKRTHILVVSEKKGGGELLAKLLDNDDTIFYLPSISSIVQTSIDFDKIVHCTITDKVVQYYKTHLTTAMSSKSLSQFCKNGKCDNLTASNIAQECLKKHMTVLQGVAEEWSLKLVSQLEMEVAYVSRDPRSIVAELMENGDVAEEAVQAFSAQLCARIDGFSKHNSSTHNNYEVVSYEKLAGSPLTTISSLYHKLLDTTNIPDITLSREYKNELYLSVSAWKTKLSTISIDAIKEECPADNNSKS